MFLGRTLTEVAHNIIFVLSLYVSIKWLILIINIIYSYVLPKFGFSCNLGKYGQWAVVTGATDGIGKEYALQLAEKGFSIVLISRSEEKLESVAEEIMSTYKVLTKTITYDYSKTDGYDMIKDQLKGLDIGILVNNVGTGYEKNVGHNDCDLSKVFDVININILSAVGMTHIITQMMMQQNRGLIIYISSLSTELNLPYISIYAATKMFLHKFSRCLVFDANNSIHHQVVVPGYVVTKLSKVKQSFGAPMPNDYVRSALGTAGRLNFTYGYWVHDLQSFILSMIPDFIIILFAMRIRKKLKKD